MVSLITAVARAPAAGDLPGALKRIAMRDDAPGARATRHRDDACALGYFEDPASPLAFGRASHGSRLGKLCGVSVGER